jgi:hypothetical protein
VIDAQLSNGGQQARHGHMVVAKVAHGQALDFGHDALARLSPAELLFALALALGDGLCQAWRTVGQRCCLVLLVAT